MPQAPPLTAWPELRWTKVSGWSFLKPETTRGGYGDRGCSYVELVSKASGAKASFANRALEL